MLKVGCQLQLLYELLQFVHDHRHCMDWKSIGLCPQGIPSARTALAQSSVGSTYCISSVECHLFSPTLRKNTTCCQTMYHGRRRL